MTRACEPRYSRSCKIAADGEDAARRTRQRGQDIPAGSNRSPFHNTRSATAIAARLADRECPSPSERECRNHEQVHRRDAVGVIMKKRLPPLGRRSPSSRHILCNGGLSDMDAELEKLAVDPWCAP